MRVQQRTLPPLVVQHQSPVPVKPAEQQERRIEASFQGERRTYCRRIEHLPILVELRSELERRRHNLRTDDTTEHVDEEI